MLSGSEKHYVGGEKHYVGGDIVLSGNGKDYIGDVLALFIAGQA